jgi:hypothetical protein
VVKAEEMHSGWRKQSYVRQDSQGHEVSEESGLTELPVHMLTWTQPNCLTSQKNFFFGGTGT